MPTSNLKLKHFDVGLGEKLVKPRLECPELKDEELFTRFLEALGRHINQTIEHDSRSHPTLNWWTGSDVKLFWDAGHQSLFDKEGKQRLAKSLAERAYKLITLHRVFGDSKYLGKRHVSEELGVDHSSTVLTEDNTSTLASEIQDRKEVKKQ